MNKSEQYIAKLFGTWIAWLKNPISNYFFAVAQFWNRPEAHTWRLLIYLEAHFE